MTFILEIVRLGLSNLRLHVLRAFLTALGIILGVAAVIAMVSLGEGSKREALAQIEQLGAKNIILRSVKPAEGGQQQSQTRRSFVSRYGLTRDDLTVITQNFPSAEAIVPLKEVGNRVLRGALSRPSQAYGTTPDLLKVAKVRVPEGRGRYLTPADLEERAMVAVLGYEIAKQLFPLEDPVGNTIRIDTQTLKVVGVLAPVGLAAGRGATLIGRDLNFDVHIPLTTARAAFGDMVFRSTSGAMSASEVQVSEIYIAAAQREDVLNDAERLRRIVDVRHADQPDVQMVVPYELLENARRAQLTWTLVLACIAGISLLVGGIGIMNIMLATVTERTREIGVRRALGATRRHIMWQFLVETSVLSTVGGLIGVGLGVAVSIGIQYGAPLLPRVPGLGKYFGSDVTLPTQVTLWSILLSFGVAVGVGLVFGLYPARKAAAQDPIVALRHD